MGAMKPYVIAIIIQMIYAGLVVVSKAAFNKGMNTFVFIFYRQAASSLLMLPVAFLLESMKFTSATVVSATYNTIPVATFCMALLFRKEVVKLRSPSGIAKLAGVAICLAGVLVIAFYSGPALRPVNPHRSIDFAAPDDAPRCVQWIKGTFLMVLANTTWSLWIVLQAALLQEYPNKMLVTLSQCVFSTVQSFIVAIVAERDFSKWKLRLDVSLIAILYSGFMLNGVCYYLQAWCVQNKGPVFLTVWTPLCLMFTIYCSTFFLGEIVHLGSILGGILLVGGLYSVLWGKGKESEIAPNNKVSVTDEAQDELDRNSKNLEQKKGSGEQEEAAANFEQEDNDEKGRGYVDSLMRVSLQLLRHGFVPEVRRHGLNLMLHLLRFRWDGLHIEEWRRSSFSADAGLIAGLYDTTDILPSKSDVAALMTEVSLSGGIPFLNDFLRSIMFLTERGPTEAELAAFILNSISESRIDCGFDPDGNQFAVILSDRDEVLPTIMLILSSLLEKHGRAVLAEQPDQLIVSRRNRALAVITCLFAANAYAKWVPVVHLDKYGLIERCKSFLNSTDLRVVALQFFKILCQRRRPLFATDDYDNVMNLVFWILMSISKDSLTELEIHHGFLGEKQLIFTGRICECLVTLGSLNMQFIIADGNRATHFFQQMLKYYQHSKFALHFRYVACDPRDVASAVNSTSMASTVKRNSGALVFVSDDILTGIMDFSLKRIPKKSASAAITPETLELWSDELQGQNGFVQYRCILLDLIRTVAYKRPVIAVSRAVQRINCIIEDASAVSKHPKDPSEAQNARLQICLFIIRICQSVDGTYLPSDIKSQRINIFEGCGPGNDLEQNIIHGIADIDCEGFTKSVDEKMLGVPRTMSCHPEKNELLLMEHNILSETFVTVASFPRIQGSNHLLTDLLHSLNTIWTQPDWEKTYVCYTYRLFGLFADYQFTTIVHLLVKSFEAVLTSNRVVESTGVEGHPSASSCILSKLILTLVLKVLGCIQTLWNGPIAYNLSGVVAEDIRLLLENGNQPMIAETKLQKTAGIWLKDIRDTG
ncbi:hypothetical protein PR202_gb13523 [Eleusine coracana subsp. coracana]|uniref:WAT1-related protein n=1 Tax=Eleusine coracana subsp. coracana TaxID=191504 RepID=A0AAV5EU01_ELECO|nr:hypothetical protein PR202_gb13523 [Eleusine coracana subsp. coracana]